MKVAFINTLYHPYSIGGAEVSLQELSESLVSLGCEVMVITLSGIKGLPARENINGVEVIRIPLVNIYWPYDNVRKPTILRALWHLLDTFNVPMALWIWRVLKNAKADIVCTNNLSGFSIACWAVVGLMRTPLIHVSRDYYLLHPSAKKTTEPTPDSLRDTVLRCWLWPRKALSKVVSGYIAISGFVMSAHNKADFFKSVDNAVIYNPVPRVDDVKARLGLHKDKIVFGFIGRIDPSKGVELMLRGLEGVGFDYQILIAGEGDSEYVETLARRFSIQPVVWLGRQDRGVFYQMIDCLLVPSIWPEPFGRIVIEANSHGKPVISSDAGGLREIVREGKTGFQFTAGSISSLRGALLRYFNARGALSSEDCVSYADSFNSISIAGKYMAFFKKVLGF